MIGSKVVFHPAQMRELCGAYVSPGRGWYHIYTFQPDRQDEEQLRWLPLEENESLVLLRLNIGAFRDRELDQQTLAFTGRILDRFAEAGKDMILRILYDVDGRGMAHEPAELDTVCQHMQNLGPIVAAHAEAILLAQGLFIGSWGEMHDSKFLAPADLRKLYATWQQATQGQIPLAVRKPVHKRILESADTVALHETHVPTRLEQKAKIGLYDDAILADETHMGTFGAKPRRQAACEESWRADDEYRFIRRQMQDLPIGGEAIGIGELDGNGIVEQLKKLPVTYLNSIYHPAALERWKHMRAPLEERETLYDYIGNHMGYRFVVREVHFRHSKLKITIENNGFAPLYEEVRLQVIVEDGQGDALRLPVMFDLRTIRPGEKKSFCVDNLPKSNKGSGYQLSMEAIRTKDGRAIRFANEGADDRLLIGSIG